MTLSGSAPVSWMPIAVPQETVDIRDDLS